MAERETIELARRRAAFEHWLADVWPENDGYPGVPPAFFAGWEAATIEATTAAEAEVRTLREALDMTANLVHGRHFHIEGLNVPFAECSSLICVGAARALAPKPAS